MKLLVTVAVALVLVMFGSGVSSAQELTTCATPTPSALQQFSGTTKTVSNPFVLPKGVYVVTGQLQGEGNLWFSIIDSSGDEVEFLAGEGPEAFEGVMTLSEDTRLIVQTTIASGPWTLDIKPAF